MQESVFVSASGVEFEIKQLIGKHFKDLSKANPGTGTLSGTEKVLDDCIIRIGNQNRPQNGWGQSFLKSLFSVDRRLALWKIRGLTFPEESFFSFDYRWPVDKKGKSEKTKHRIDLSEENFPVKPFYWVKEKLDSLVFDAKKLAKDAQTEFDESDFIAKNGFPICFENYGEMLDKHKYYEFKTRAGNDIKMQTPDGQTEYKTVKLQPESMSHHTLIEMRDPKKIVKEDDGERPIIVRLDDITSDEYMDLYHAIGKYEAEFDTIIPIQNEQDGRTKNVNILLVPDFFLPTRLIS